MFLKISRVLIAIVLSLMVMSCGTLKIDQPSQKKKTELPPDVGSNKYSKKRSGK